MESLITSYIIMYSDFPPPGGDIDWIYFSFHPYILQFSLGIWNLRRGFCESGLACQAQLSVQVAPAANSRARSGHNGGFVVGEFVWEVILDTGPFTGPNLLFHKSPERYSRHRFALEKLKVVQVVRHGRSDLCGTDWALSGWTWCSVFSFSFFFFLAGCEEVKGH